MHSQWEDIDAVKAKEYLTGSETKRAQTRSTISMYARDMADGAWFPTHQGIAFADRDGTEVLVDGGHRMRAVEEADRLRPGITVRFWVTRGLDPAAFEGFDIGRTRTTANMVQAWYPEMANFKDVAAIGRRGVAYTAGHPWVRVQPSKHELHKFIEEHPSILEAAHLSHSWKMPRATLAASSAGFCYWVLMKIDHEDGLEFMTNLRRGTNLDDSDPVHVLRNRLLGTETTRRPETIAYAMRARGREPEIAIALTMIAWNKHRSHQAISKLQLPGAFSDENFPVPRELISWTDPRGILNG